MKKIILVTHIAMTLIIIGSVVMAYSHAEQVNTGFGIFLTENNELVLSDEHIKSYDRHTHEIELNAKGIQKWESYIAYDESFDPPIPKLKELYTKDFVIKIRGQEMYHGKFWSFASSASYAGAVIVDVLGLFDNKIRIEFGYPGSSNTTKKDPRNRLEIMNYLKKHDLLK